MQGWFTGRSRGRAFDWRSARVSVVRGVLAALLAGSPAPLFAQDDAEPVELGALIRTGLLLQPSSSGLTSGFEIFDARLDVGGSIGIIFDYYVQGSFQTLAADPDDEGEFTLLDARLTVPIHPAVDINIGQFKAPVGHEALLYKADIQFVERSQVMVALAPFWQIGLGVSGTLLEDRFWYGAGMFNGNGRNLRNDNSAFMYAGRVQYSSVGDIEFYDDLVIQVGANAAFSRDSSVDLQFTGDLGPPPINAASFEGDRFLWGLDAGIRYRGFFANGEYLQGRLTPSAMQGDSVLAPDPATAVAAGYYVEGGYSLWGAIEAVLRYDWYSPASESPGTTDAADEFLIVGLNFYPGFYAKVGMQYAFGLGGTQTGVGLVGDQFALLVQLAF